MLLALQSDMLLGGLTYRQFIADTIGLLDATSKVSATKRLPADLLGEMDATTRLSAELRVLADQVGLLDAPSYLKGAFITLNNTIGLLDAASEVSSYRRAPGDLLGLLDAVAGIQAAKRTPGETIGLLDATSYRKGLLSSVANVLGLLDTANRSGALKRSAADLLGLLDALSWVSATKRAPGDVLGLLDARAVSHGWVRNPADVLGITETTAGTPADIRFSGGYYSSPDTPVLGITGDLQIEMEFALDVVGPRTHGAMLASKTTGVSGHQSWAFWVGADGLMNFGWSVSGASINIGFTDGAVPVVAPGQFFLVRFTFDADNGASGCTGDFQYSTDGGSTWTHGTGDPQTTTPASSIFDSNAEVEIGSDSGGAGTAGSAVNVQTATGVQIRAFRLYNGIAGTKVLDWKASEASVATSYVDDTTAAWTAHGTLVHEHTNTVTVVSVRPYFGGEVSTPDVTANHFTGDLDVFMDVALDNWIPAADQPLLSKWVSPSQDSWRFYIQASTGNLACNWTEVGAGIDAGLITTGFFMPVLANGQRVQIRVYHDVNDGAGGSNFVFSYSTDGGVTFSAPVTSHAFFTTSHFNSTSPIEIGSRNNGASGQFASGKFYEAWVKNGIGGTKVADWKASEINYASPTPYTDSTAAVWAQSAAAFETTENLGPGSVDPFWHMLWGRLQADLVGLLDNAVRVTAVKRTLADLVGLTDIATPGNRRLLGDLLGITDARTRAASYPRLVADLIGLLDARTAIQVIRRLPADQLGLLDAIAWRSTTKRTPADILGLTDARLLFIATIRSLNNTIGLLDAIHGASGTARTTGPDALGLLDARSWLTLSVRQPGDLLGLLDAAAGRSATKRTTGDLLGLLDALSQPAMLKRVIADALGLHDAITGDTPSIFRSPADVLGLLDAAALQVAYRRAVANTLGLTDAAILSGTAINQALRLVADMISTSDATIRVAAMQRVLSDLLGGIDSVIRTEIALRAQADILGLLDGALPQITFLSTPANVIGMHDSMASVSGPQRAIADSIGIFDRVAQVIAYLRTQADVLGLLDQPQPVRHVFRTSADVVGFIDALSRAVAFTRSPSDGLGATDHTSYDAGIRRTRADVIGVQDLATGAIARLFLNTVADHVGLQDARRSGLLIHAAAADTLNVTDATVFDIILTFVLGDTLGLSDHTIRNFIGIVFSVVYGVELPFEVDLEMSAAFDLALSIGR